MEHHSPNPPDRSRDAPEPEPTAAPQPDDFPIRGSPLEKVSHYLRGVFADADARGETISRDDAQAIASLLAPLLDADAAMNRLADTGEVDAPRLQDECAYLRGRTWQTPDVSAWAERLEHYLTAQPTTDTPIQPGPPTAESPPDIPPVAQGLHEHGDAFRAFLQLPDTDPHDEGLIDAFLEFYDGVFASMDELVEAKTDIRACRTAVKNVAAAWGYEEFVTLDGAKIEAAVRATWDVVEIGGRFYVFSK